MKIIKNIKSYGMNAVSNSGVLSKTYKADILWESN